MTSNISNSYSKLRLAGMVSGLDTDSIIEQLMKIESLKVNKVKQEKQLLEWKRDNYRDITNAVRSFKDNYFDVLKPGSNFRSANAFATYKVSSGDESLVVAKAGTGAASATHSITVRKLASAATIEKADPSLQVTDSVDGSADITDFDLAGKQILINFDGVSKTIALDNYTGATTEEKMADMVSKLKSAIDSAMGSGKLDVVANGTKLEFKAQTNGSTFTLQNVSSGDGLEKLGFTAADNNSNRISLSSSLSSIESHFSNAVGFDPDTNVSFVINGTTINLNKKFSEATIQDVITAVNTSSANVTLKYDSLRDKFSMTTKGTGAAETISITDTDATNGLFKALGIEAADLTRGQDAEFDLDGVTGMKRSSNNFAIDGVTYTLKGVSDPVKAVGISVEADVNAVVDKIKEFVGKYNELIDKINTEYSEDYDSDYTPLTDEQREGMSEEEIKKWEDKAKTGLLRGDSILGSIVNDMRKALYAPVDGAATSLSKIGITTGSYTDKGKLVIDENKLRTAVTNDIDSVVKLFTKESDISYEDAMSNSSKKAERYKESGLGQRLYDIIQDNIRTTRDKDGKKGALLEKAGITGDISEFKNLLSEQIDKKDTQIYTLLDKLADKEDALYKKYAALETALSKMNSQSSWLTQQLGGGS